MLNTEKNRWLYRFDNYKKALSKLEEAVHRIALDFPFDHNGRINQDDFLVDIIKEGVIQRFEYTHELAWNVMKDFLNQAGNTNIFGSKDATKEAFAAGLLSNGEVWMDMIKSRNKTSYTYNEETADAIFIKIILEYVDEFSKFKHQMEELQDGN